MRVTVPTAVAALVFFFSATAAGAQSLTTVLTRLLTEQQPSGVFVPDAAAATATLETVAGLFSVELPTIPVASSSGGFVYKLNRTLGVVQRVSNGFGPFFTEAVLRGGQDQAGIGIRYQVARFTSLQGGDLTSGRFPTNATRRVGASEPFSVDMLELDLVARTISLVGSYGLSERLSVGGVLPVSNIRVQGRRLRDLNGEVIPQSNQTGSITGFGDLSGNVRYRLIDRGVSGVSIGGDLRLPTGSEQNLMGTGKVAGRLLGIGTWEERQLAVHVNGGVGVGGVSREVFYSAATTFALTPRLTVVGELMGRHLAELTRLQDVYQVSGQSGLETMRWLPVERGLFTNFLNTGAKWNITGSWMLNANVLVRLSDVGLRARATPTLALEFDFQQ
jgi:hypothetical protein